MIMGRAERSLTGVADETMALRHLNQQSTNGEDIHLIVVLTSMAGKTAGSKVVPGVRGMVIRRLVVHLGARSQRLALPTFPLLLGNLIVLCESIPERATDILTTTPQLTLTVLNNDIASLDSVLLLGSRVI